MGPGFKASLKLKWCSRKKKRIYKIQLVFTSPGMGEHALYFGASLPYKSGPLFASMSLDFSVSVIPCKLAQDKMAHLEIRNPARRCGDSFVIGNLGFSIAAGVFLALRSPYGCGKGDLPCL